MAITYRNRETFISVVAWMLILWGLFSGYGWFSQLTTRLLFFTVDQISISTVAFMTSGVFFSVAAAWCGLGLRKRQRSRLRALIVFFWLYIVWAVGLNFWGYIQLFDMFSSLGTGSLDFSDRERFSLAVSVSGSIKVVLESALIIWLIQQLSRPLIQEEFEA